MGNVSQYLSPEIKLDNLDQGYVLHKRIIEYNKQYAGKGYAQPFVTLYYYIGNNTFSYLESTNIYVPIAFNNGKGFIIQQNDGKLYLYLVPQQVFKNVSSSHDKQSYLGYLVNLHKANQEIELDSYVWTTDLTIPHLYFANASDDNGTDMTIPDSANLSSLFLGYQVTTGERSQNAKDYTWIATPSEFPTLDLLYADNNKSLVINLTDSTVSDDLQNNSIDIINQLKYE